ncbi:uncharacterized protein BJ212DRAFT_1488739 [Suillus subaureus]|uniref:ATP-dependent DNA ligase family profile domain-containing protein n=1 Tax=Suillus subaureus TaxID=48587 RepID=A0A9P7DLT1_9AGAM|nr:uncharacterized protein BJ212DRAFT_1488739 [Suillus subaureus]KAG1798001.1 hypothetical protein BJ212DRAFT_1488739 [Suillus subaureus]
MEKTAPYPPPPQNNGSAPFSVLAGLFEKLSTERKPERRRRLLDVWFNHWREEIGHDLYPVLRLILPQAREDLAKTYIKLIPLGIRDPDAIRLLNWKKPTEKDKSSGDFPTVLYEVVSKRSSGRRGKPNMGKRTDDDILHTLWLMTAHGTFSPEFFSVFTIVLLLRNSDGLYTYFERHVVPFHHGSNHVSTFQDMVISVKETTVFGVFHPDAQDLFNICSDLKKVAWELWDPSRRLNAEDKSIQLFRAFAPMLCKRPTHKIEDSVKEMQGHKFIIEEKLDGERMQLHKRGNEYFYCSR